LDRHEERALLLEELLRERILALDGAMGTAVQAVTLNVVDNDGNHAMQEASGQIGLKAGKHAIKVAQYEGTGGQGLEVRYECVAAGIAKSPIPDGVLYRKDMGGGPIAVTYPNGGESLRVGETVTIRWTADLGLIPDALIQVSPDDGENWCIINETQAVLPSQGNWGNYQWTIPDSMQSDAGKISLASTKCLVRVQTYSYEYPDASDSWFTVINDSPVGTQRSATATANRAYTDEALEAAVMREFVEKKGKPIYPNVDFYSAVVYLYMDLPPRLATALFAIARVSGWAAHVMEQYSDNRLIRPRAKAIRQQR